MSKPDSSPLAHQPLVLLEGIGARLIDLPRGICMTLVLLWAGGLWGLSARPGIRILENESFLQAWTFNTGHAFLYGILTLLCVACLPRREGWVLLDRVHVLGVLVLVMTYGFLDEWHQSWVPDRSASGLDLMTDLVGVVATLAVIGGLGSRSALDRVEQAGRLRWVLLLGFVLSWVAGMAATLLDVGLEAGVA
ncbi:MAG TPA: hypothetical protein EYQ25_05295 [Planctomycetes bacterium]|nr:hypothetical protein [Planctomycetota bacterium]HIL36188.1 hypothetical protein [Planctomycetota bacterium]